MASRLSEESIRESYDRGYRSISVSDSKESVLSVPQVNLSEILKSENSREKIQALAPQELYRALRVQGVEDNLDALAMISTDQLTRLIDYDCWETDQFNPLKMVYWLSLYGEMDKVGHKMAERFIELEEEYQLTFCGSYLKIYDEDEFEKLPGNEQDKCTALPCHTLYYIVEADDDRIQASIERLIPAVLSLNLKYGYSLLAHAAYAVPNESHQLIEQFRKARLEEDGFVSVEESETFFQPVVLPKKSQQSTDSRGLSKRVETPVNFLDAVLGGLTEESVDVALITQQFAHFANALCAACRVEPDDYHDLRKILSHSQGIASLGLEYLAGGDLEQGKWIVQSQGAKEFFRTGLTLVRNLEAAMWDSLEASGFDVANFRQLSQLRRYGVLLDNIDRQFIEPIGVEDSEIMKGLCNRFPVIAERSGEVDGVNKITFRSVASLKDLEQLTRDIVALCGKIWIASQVSGSTLSENIYETIGGSVIGLTTEQKLVKKTPTTEGLALLRQKLQGDSGFFASKYLEPLRLKMWQLPKELMEPALQIDLVLDSIGDVVSELRDRMKDLIDE